MSRIYQSRQHRFRPDAISNIVYFGESEFATNSGGFVSKLANQAATGNTFDLVQNIAGKKPTFVSNQLNGYPIIRTDGIAQYLQGNAGWGPMSNQITGLTVIMVAKITSSAANKYLFFHGCGGADTSAPRMALIKSSGNLLQSAIRNADGDTTDFPTGPSDDGSKFVIISAVNDYATPLGTFYKDGVAKGTASAGLTGNSTTNSNSLITTVGCRGNLVNFVGMDIAALAVIKDALYGDKLSIMNSIVANWRGKYLI